VTTPEKLARETAWPVDHWRHVDNLLGSDWPRLIPTVLALVATGMRPGDAASSLLSALAPTPAPTRETM
jgi:hypothetical protein